MTPLRGIHHVTAICGNPQRNVDFYTGTLGLRLVKKTVNFDDPASYHLYYGDQIGTPGTLVTFFAWPKANPGQPGAGEPVGLGFAVPNGSLDWWKRRFSKADVPCIEIGRVFGEEMISVSDPDGLRIELIESKRSRQFAFWPDGGIAHENAIRAIHSVELSIHDRGASAALFTNELTFRQAGIEDTKHLFEVGTSQSFVHIVQPLSEQGGEMGAGSIHHVAFRTDDDASQLEWRQKLTALGLSVSPVMDRSYFRSIYFREVGGVLFEIATDGPGFATDESVEHLGEALKLPAQYEPLRPQVERVLPPIVTPQLMKSTVI
jgi:glyoxalase family protein